MADQQMPPPQGGGYGAAASDPLRKNVSAFNPMDMAMIKKEGQFDPNMKVVDALRQLGIDPEGPAQQLVEFGKKQIENGDMMGKMQNISQDSQGGGQPPASAPGLEGLLG